MTINDFQGQVRIQDIQNAFNEIVSSINSQVDTYNELLGLLGVDITKGAPLLGASQYTLTIGGLKSVLNNYNNTLIGGKVFRIDTDKLLLTDGIFIKSSGVQRIQAQVVDIEEGDDLSNLYYDIDNDIAFLINEETIMPDNYITISHLNKNSNNFVLNDIPNVQLENENAKLKVDNQYIPNSRFEMAWQTLDTSESGKFVCYMMNSITNAGESLGSLTFMNLPLYTSYNSNSGIDRKHWSAQPVYRIFIPHKFTPTIYHSGRIGQYVAGYTIT